MDPLLSTQDQDRNSTPSSIARTSVAVDHRGYRLHATASRRITGTVLVNAELSGGPGAIRRYFCIASERPDPASACEQCIGELREVVDALCSASLPPT